MANMEIVDFTIQSNFLICSSVIFDFFVWYFGKNKELYGNDDVKKTDDSGESIENEPLNKCSGR